MPTVSPGVSVTELEPPMLSVFKSKQCAQEFQRIRNKRNQMEILELKNITARVNNSFDGFKSRLVTTEKRMSKVKNSEQKQSESESKVRDTKDTVRMSDLNVVQTSKN